EEDYMDVQDELIDRYGEPPKSVANLLEIALIKGMANHLGITTISIRNRSVILEVKKDAEIDPTKIPDVIKLDEKRRRFTINEKPYFTLNLDKKDAEIMLDYIKSLLQDIKDLMSV
ncbi:MAG: hypothetical protein JW708_01190, partial [Vallitaleaceae bacterium]|nr:hypothetical protein [Vallitaleaceae bacterium]